MPVKLPFLRLLIGQEFSNQPSPFPPLCWLEIILIRTKARGGPLPWFEQPETKSAVVRKPTY